MKSQKDKRSGENHQMKEELEKILTNLSDAGCGREELETARKLYEAGDTEALIRTLCESLTELLRRSAKT